MSNFRLRLWRRFRLAPGVTVNLSNRGLSTSFGVKGAHVTVGRKGTRATIGAPGTGIYLTKFDPYQSSAPRNAARRAAPRLVALPRNASQHNAPQRSATSFNPVTTFAGGFLKGIGWVMLAIVALAIIAALVGA